MTKQMLRKELKRRRGQVPKEKRTIWDQAIAEHLFEFPLYRQAHKVMTYLSFGWEVATWSIVEHMQGQGKEVYVPVVQNEPRALIPRLYTGRENLTPQVYGILEPGPDAPEARPEELDLILVPGLVFSEQGYRVGYGGGYYDRFLPTTRGTALGLVYSSFIQDVRHDPWDYAVDFLVTEEGVLSRK